MWQLFPRLVNVNRRIVSSHSFHSNSPDFQPRNTVHVSEPKTKYVRVLHKKTVQRVIGFGLHCNVSHLSAMKSKYYYRVKVNGLPLTREIVESHLIKVGDFFTLDSPVYDMEDGIFYRIKCAEIVKIERRDKSAEPSKPLKPGARQIIKRISDKWVHLVTLSVTWTTKKFYRRIKYNEIPKKGHEAFKLMVKLSTPFWSESDLNTSEKTDEETGLEVIAPK